MSPHRESEELSAYVDGELDAIERARVEQHLSACAECRATLDEVQSARSALRELPEPRLSAEQIATLDAAVERAAASPPKRSRFRVVVGGAVAVAAVAAAFAIVPHLHSPPRATSGLAAPAVPVSGPYDSASARAALLAFAASAPHRQAGFGANGGGLSSSAPQSKALGQNPATVDSLAPTDCDARIRSAGDDVRLDHTQDATFVDKDGKATPATLLFYLAPASKPTRAELWVVRPSDCFTLFFSQASLQ